MAAAALYVMPGAMTKDNVKVHESDPSKVSPLKTKPKTGVKAVASCRDNDEMISLPASV